MFKKLLKAALPALFVFSFANVNDAKVEAANKKINVRVDYLEEGSNKKLAESAKLSGDENVFATISLPQNLANEYNISKRDFSNESKGQIAANILFSSLVHSLGFIILSACFIIFSGSCVNGLFPKNSIQRTFL